MLLTDIVWSSLKDGPDHLLLLTHPMSRDDATALLRLSYGDEPYDFTMEHES